MGNRGRVIISPKEVCLYREQKIYNRRSIRRLIFKAVMILLSAYLILQYVFGIAVEQGQSMYPAIQDGDVVFYYRLDHTYDIGNIVTFKKDGTRYFGRVVAKPGDEVDMSDEGDLLINGNVQSENVLYPTYKEGASTAFPCKVLDGEVFLLGDMRTSSVDSRDYGTVSQKEIDGIVFTVIKRREI